MHADHTLLSEKQKNDGVTPPNDEQSSAEQRYWLYVVAQALRDGRFPDNIQIDEALSWLRDHIPSNTTHWSSDGKKVLNDIRDIIDVVGSTTYTTTCVQLSFMKPDQAIGQREECGRGSSRFSPSYVVNTAEE